MMRRNIFQTKEHDAIGDALQILSERFAAAEIDRRTYVTARNALCQRLPHDVYIPNCSMAICDCCGKVKKISNPHLSEDWYCEKCGRYLTWRGLEDDIIL